MAENEYEKNRTATNEGIDMRLLRHTLAGNRNNTNYHDHVHDVYDVYESLSGVRAQHNGTIFGIPNPGTSSAR